MLKDFVIPSGGGSLLNVIA